MLVAIRSERVSLNSNNVKWYSWNKWTMPNTLKKIAQVWNGSKMFPWGYLQRHYSFTSQLRWLSTQDITQNVYANNLWIWPMGRICPYIFEWVVKNRDYTLSLSGRALRRLLVSSEWPRTPGMNSHFLSWGHWCIKLECNLLCCSGNRNAKMAPANSCPLASPFFL